MSCFFLVWYIIGGVLLGLFLFLPGMVLVKIEMVYFLDV